VFVFAECFLTLGKVFAECPKKALGKEPFADKIFVECSLPSVTLGKGFAECKIAFAAIPVVYVLPTCISTYVGKYGSWAYIMVQATELLDLMGLFHINSLNHVMLRLI
jgi:hypothetical protein